ncbi:alpha/beta hydrolase [Novilysobacter avium]|uniref:Alpha/beta hydrolase n=1 Tax=Novilysobacter avium TaxID=2781023 RepID=A0A7S6UIW3_9GAMM|nr:alpha/beta hydrolase [Lysobacter avium]QOW21102.1 alpha/beta hydrolase [Lysobacter avium]
MKIVVSTLGLLVIATLPTSTSASTSPCSAAEQVRSDSYYTPTGLNLPNATGLAPKFCPRGKIERYSVCGKPGGQAAIKFFHDNLSTINFLAGLSGTAYDAEEKLVDGVQGNARYVVADEILLSVPDSRTRPAFAPDYVHRTSDVTLPKPNRTRYYYDPDTRLYFSVSRRYGKDKENVIFAFKGTTMTSGRDWWADAINGVGGSTGIYDEAVNVTQDLVAQTVREGRGCSTSFIYTGHSLGGGLAVRAAQLAGERCGVKTDSLVVFNPALPAFGQSWVTRKNTSVSLAAFFSTPMDPVTNTYTLPDFLSPMETTKSLLDGLSAERERRYRALMEGRLGDLVSLDDMAYSSRTKLLNDLAKQAQVIQFPNVTVHRNQGTWSQWLNNVAPLMPHRMSPIQAELSYINYEHPAYPQRLSDAQAEEVCDFYRPLYR